MLDFSRLFIDFLDFLNFVNPHINMPGPCLWVYRNIVWYQKKLLQIEFARFCSVDFRICYYLCYHWDFFGIGQYAGVFTKMAPAYLFVDLQSSVALTKSINSLEKSRKFLANFLYEFHSHSIMCRCQLDGYSCRYCYGSVSSWVIEIRDRFEGRLLTVDMICS